MEPFVSTLAQERIRMSRKPFISALCGLSLSVFFVGAALAQPAGTTSTTTVETTKKIPATKKAPVKVEETTTTSTTVNTPPPPAPEPPKQPRAVYDQEALKKMEGKLCVEGFKSYVGNESKNVCNSTANPPDLAYTCVWDKDGPEAFPASPQGPCTLDYSEHRGEVLITREKWKDNPPMKYGSKALCCYRAAK